MSKHNLCTLSINFGYMFWIELMKNWFNPKHAAKVNRKIRYIVFWMIYPLPLLQQLTMALAFVDISKVISVGCLLRNQTDNQKFYIQALMQLQERSLKKYL